MSTSRKRNMLRTLMKLTRKRAGEVTIKKLLTIHQEKLRVHNRRKNKIAKASRKQNRR